MDYSIAAIPTVYKGRSYRSRLEARWAAFFDHLGIKHEYEPFDLGGWSPDFLLPELETLVEVKPLSEFDADVWAKMVAACQKRGLLTDKKVLGGLLMTRLAPTHIKTANGAVEIGWLGLPWLEGGMDPQRALLGWVPDGEQPIFWPEIVGLLLPRIGWASTTGEVRCFSEAVDPWPTNEELDRLAWPETYTEYTMKLWARATSDVQWQPDDEA